MDIEQRNTRLDLFFSDCSEILKAKGQDYNPDGIAFSEIRKEAADLGLKPEQYMMVLASKHWGAIKRFANTGRLESEPIKERLKDLANYCAMLSVMLEENKGR